MLRSILAVIAGYVLMEILVLAFFSLSGQDPAQVPPTGLMVVSIVFAGGVAGVGGYISALMARRRELAHAAVLALLVGLVAVASIVAKVGKEPLWTQLTGLVVMVPSVLLGGYFRLRRRRSATAET